LRVDGHSREELARLLTYRDLSVDFELQKFKQNAAWHKQKLGPEGFVERLEELKASQKKTLLYEDDDGLWTFSGFAPRLQEHFGEPVTRGYKLPLFGTIPWAKKPVREPRPYQVAGNQALLGAFHGAVEVGTGLGKTFQSLMLVKEHGLQTVVMAPSTSIAEQLYDDFLQAFGKSKVGFFGGGKKEYGKLITIAIAASLTKVEPGTPAFAALNQAKVFIADESHLCPAKTLQKVCFGVVGNAPYRYFFSGTQMRGDGADLLLEGITGAVVFRMSVKEGVDQGYLARPFFRVVNVNSSKNYYNKDADRMTRVHLYYNDEVLRAAADIANKSVEFLHQQVLVLVEEYEQFQRLLPLLKFEVGFAHGPITKDNKDVIPAAYHDTDNKELVAKFNAKQLPILVGTSCISTGTDIQTVENVIFLRGGKSEVQVRQACGRGTRKIEGTGKTCFNFTDFRVSVDCMPEGQKSVVERHLEERLEIFDDIYPNATTEMNYVSR
jgi:superfamily II DNA or RNA helicase